MTKIRNIIVGVAIVIYTILLVIFVKDVSAAVLNSLKVCIETIIPSLYAFMIISEFIISSNLYKILSKPFSLISRYVFRIPEQFFSIFLIGSIGGYPIGAKLLTGMYKENKIDKETAEHMINYCYLAGPAFICSIAGIKIFSSLKAGIIIFTSIICANILIAFISGMKRSIPPKSKYSIKLELSFSKLIQSIYDGAKGMFSICTIIIFFSSFICIAEKTGIISFAAKLISDYTNLNYINSIAAVKSFIEISNITLLETNNYNLIPLAASLLSFGGLCVLMQIEGITANKILIKHFYLYRIMSMFLSYLLCKLLSEFLNVNYVSVLAPAGIIIRQNSPIPTIFLLIMTILLLSNISMAKSKKM